MARKKESKKIDVQKFKELLKENGLTMTSLSVEIGHEVGYIYKNCHKGVASKYTIQYLKNKYGISYEEYRYGAKTKVIEETPVMEEVKEEPQEEKTEIQPVVNNNIMVSLTKEELGEIIYQAVYSAMAHAWKDM